MALFTRVLGWKKPEVEVFLVDVRRDMKNTKIHAYKNVYVPSGFHNLPALLTQLSRYVVSAQKPW